MTDTDPRIAEALFMFMAWLTTRPQEHAVTFSAVHDSAIAAELVGEFIDFNGLQEPRDDWGAVTELRHPK